MILTRDKIARVVYDLLIEQLFLLPDTPLCGFKKWIDLTEDQKIDTLKAVKVILMAKECPEDRDEESWLYKQTSRQWLHNLFEERDSKGNKSINCFYSLTSIQADRHRIFVRMVLALSEDF